MKTLGKGSIPEYIHARNIHLYHLAKKESFEVKSASVRM